MRLSCARLVHVTVGAILCLGRAQTNAADDLAPTNPASPPVANRPLHTLPQRPLKSPIDSFRKLLAMSPAERERYLTNYPAAAREKILDKVEEYSHLPPDYRELRLQVTELRWYLLPVLRLPPASRAAHVQLIPEPYQKLVSARLEEWDIWPPSLKDEVLEYETTLSRFVGRNTEGTPVVQPQMNVDDLSERDRLQAEQKLARWQELPPGERRQMFASFQRFFDLSESEKEKTLDALSESQRQEAEKVLSPIEKKPKSEQEQYLAAFRQFSEMSAPEREQFMKNAGRWRQMSPAERQAWRDLVKQLSEMPPLPPDLILPRAQPIGPATGTNSVVPK
jgi:hypothetical protein